MTSTSNRYAFESITGLTVVQVVQKGLETNLHIVLALRSKYRFEPDFRDKIRTPFSGIHKTYTSLGAELRQ